MNSSERTTSVDLNQLLGMLTQYVQESGNPFEALNVVREHLHSISPNKTAPVDLVRWIPAEKIHPNDWNPNAVASVEMNLLAVSISHDGYTQPIVTVYEPKTDMYQIVDGFHRWYTGSHNEEINEMVHGHLPVVVLDKSINDRMAATVRHNRARGRHSVQGMSSMVFDMLENGWQDHEICNELGMSAEELLRLKHITGFSKLFKDAQYSREWKTKSQVRVAAKAAHKTPGMAKRAWARRQAAEQAAKEGSR